MRRYKRRRKVAGLVAILAALIITIPAGADDGEMFRKNVSNTPELETEFAAIRMLPIYVRAQNTAGELITISYPDADGNVLETDNRDNARPLIAHYTDGHVDFIEEEGYGGFPGHGTRDAFGAVSLDDGATWKRTNLSRSADLSSFKIKVKKKRVPYPGDVGRTFMASDGNKVLVVWVSRYAGGGNPNYAMSDEERTNLEAHFDFGTGTCNDLFDDEGKINNLGTPCLYLEDYFGVAGSQGSSELADEGYPLIGELPYAAVWAARGVLLPGTQTTDENGNTITTESKFIWFKPERLTSGVRDANRPEAVCVKGAGCAITWQEDPDGIRPGHGDGPGEGWSGAIAHHQTDTWYSYIGWDDFDLVGGDIDQDQTDEYGEFYNGTGSLLDWIADNTTGSPKAAVPMSIPVRLTDNAMCVSAGNDGNGAVIYDENECPYCYADFDGSGPADFCASSVSVEIATPEGPTQTINMCVTEDGRLMRGNTASTRARIGLHGYSSVGEFDKSNPDTCPINSAWFYMAYEENKGLGDICDDGDCLELTDADKRDMGKNVWYHTFDMFGPELVSQGLMLNQPAVYPDGWSDPSGLLVQDPLSGYNNWAFDEDPIYNWQAGIETTTLYQTEISRRPSQISQDWYDAGDIGTIALQLWKQGIIRRGGPADIMGRRFVIPDDFDATTDNPYGYDCMECLNADGFDAWAFTDGLNPRYVKGLCAAPAINLSGNTIITSEICGNAAECLTAFPFNDYFDDLDMTDSDPISKIWTWEQFGPGYGETPPDNTNLDDVSWENPYDVAKGHRGFMTGDMIMAMYAWAPNWNALTKGHENFNLYARRSFDGGETWSTLPDNFTHTDGITYAGAGTTTYEWWIGSDGEYPQPTTYAAGDFEQARNLSQLTGSNVTVLDPRYTPTTRGITTNWVNTSSLPSGFLAPEYLDDTRDPSRFFMIYETGLNAPYDVGEAEPLDLFYSRAVNWGDDYLVWQDVVCDACLPAADTEDDFDLTGFCNEFDALEGSQLSESGEACVTTSPGGQFFYAIWNQWDFDRDGHEIGADAWFRRILFLDDYIPPIDDGSGGDDDDDDEKPGKKPKKEK